MAWLVALALVGWFFYSGQGDPIEGALNLLDTLQGQDRGAALTNAPADSNGVVGTDPQQLADLAGLSLDVYAMARMIASEEPHSDSTTKAAVAWALKNHADQSGSTVSEVLLRAKNSAHNGLFGAQQDKDPDSSNYKGSDRYATTALDPHELEGTIAAGVFDGSIPDLTNGAQQFDRPGGEKNPASVAAKRTNAGAVVVEVEGADPGLRFWRT